MARSSPWRLVFLIALLCAVGVRLLTPPGWMPNLDGAPGGPLVICTGDGVHAAPASDPTTHGHAGRSGHEVCPFGGFALGGAPHAIQLSAPLVLPRASATRLAEDQARIAPLWRRPQAARAPPLIV